MDSRRKAANGEHLSVKTATADRYATLRRVGTVTLSIVSLLACFWLTGPTSGSPAAARFSRGIAIAHVMGWAQVEPAPSTQFSFPPFRGSGRSLAHEELIALRRAGFDFVRLAVDPGPFLQFESRRRDMLDAIMADHDRLILSSGLSVIIDFHPSDLHSTYTSQALTTAVHADRFQAYLDLLGRTAALLATMESGRVALEIMNEPPIRTSAWQPMLEAAYAAIRIRARNLPIVVSGGEEGSAQGLIRIATRAFAADVGVLFSFHFYDPYQFTHQGASWNAARYLADVPYPANARPMEESVRATTDLIEVTGLPQPAKRNAYLDALNQLQSYRRSGFSRATIAHTFERVERWAQDNGIPSSRILLGEFGAMRTERQRAQPAASERTNWFRDVREEAEERGFGWAVWVYHDSGGFSLTEAQSGTGMDPAVIAALGLTGRPHTDSR